MCWLQARDRHPVAERQRRTNGQQCATSLRLGAAVQQQEQQLTPGYMYSSSN